jgi:hypothetical protein
MAAMGQLLGAALAGAGVTFVAMQFMQKPDPAVEAAMPPDVKNNRLKKTLSTAGLYPQPEGGKLKSTPSGSMAVFASGEKGAALAKGGGEPL